MGNDNAEIEFSTFKEIIAKITMHAYQDIEVPISIGVDPSDSVIGVLQQLVNKS